MGLRTCSSSDATGSSTTREGGSKRWRARGWWGSSRPSSPDTLTNITASVFSKHSKGRWKAPTSSGAKADSTFGPSFRGSPCAPRPTDAAQDLEPEDLPLMNVYAAIIFGALILEHGIHLTADFLNLGTLTGDVPDEFRGFLDAQTYRKSQEYTRARLRFGMIKSLFDL